jgi:hypothetical protein
VFPRLMLGPSPLINRWKGGASAGAFVWSKKMHSFCSLYSAMTHQFYMTIPTFGWLVKIVTSPRSMLSVVLLCMTLDAAGCRNNMQATGI